MKSRVLEVMARKTIKEVLGELRIDIPRKGLEWMDTSTIYKV